MPTKDIDLGLVRILPYIYELSIVLLCARAEMENIYE